MWPDLLFIELLRYHFWIQVNGFQLFKTQSRVSEPSHLLHHCLLQLRKYSVVLTKTVLKEQWNIMQRLLKKQREIVGTLTCKRDKGATVCPTLRVECLILGYVTRVRVGSPAKLYSTIPHTDNYWNSAHVLATESVPLYCTLLLYLKLE